ARLVALLKDDLGVNVRPIACGEVLRKLVAKVICRQRAKALRARFCGRRQDDEHGGLRAAQIGVAVKGGADLGVHTVQAALDRHPEWVCVKADARNAFNAVHREAMFEAIERDFPELWAWTDLCGVYTAASCALTVDQDSQVSSNMATINGGGIVLGEDSRLEVATGSQLDNNSCLGNGGALDGGPVTNVSIRESALLRNTAGREGGGVYLHNGLGSDRTSTLTVVLSTISENTARIYSGGGICSNLFCHLELRNATLSGNTAGYRGGAIAAYYSDVDIRVQTTISQNSAADGGGIFIAGLVEMTGEFQISWAYAGLLHVEDTELRENVAESHGGALQAIEGAEAHIRRSDLSTRQWILSVEEECTWRSMCVFGNSAASGAAMDFDNTSNITVESTLFFYNTLSAESHEEEYPHGGVVNLHHDSTVAIFDCQFVSNLGSAIQAEEGSTVMVTGSYIVNHTADQGSAVRVAAGAAAAVSKCSFMNGTAYEGGAVYSEGNFSVIGSRFEGHVARANGGGIYLGLSQGTTVEMSKCEFIRNTVDGSAEDILPRGNGGALYLTADAEFQMNNTHFEALRFSYNTATQGGAIGFWQPHDLLASPDAPPCIDCELLNDTNQAAYGTPDGWATQARLLQVAPDRAEEAAGEKVVQDIEVRITDVHGETVTVDNSSMVEMRFANPAVCYVEEGSTRLQAVNGVVTFSGAASGLTLKGSPGTRCEMYFTSDFDALYESEAVSDPIVVPLRHCLQGEELTGEAPWQYCRACDPGWLSLDNATACVDCAKHLDCSGNGDSCPIECLGQNAFVVCQGTYLAPQAQFCEGRADATECLLDRAYKCDVKDACTTNNGESACSWDGDAAAGDGAGRTGIGATSVANLQLCDDAVFIGSSVALCGSYQPVLCASLHYPSLLKDECIECSSRGMVLFSFIAGWTALALLIVAMLMVFLWAQGRKECKEYQEGVSQQLVNGEAQTTSIQILKAKQALSLVVGYFQVMGQLTPIYDEDLVPGVLGKILAPLGVFNFDIHYMLNISCFRSYFLPSTLEGSNFMLTFWQSVATPWVICAMFVVFYYSLLYYRERERGAAAKVDKSHTEADDTQPDIQAEQEREQKAEEVEMEWRTTMRAACMGAALFLMMFLHPGTATVMFQIFDCKPIYFDDESLKMQLWLRQDSGVECLTPSWWFAAMCGAFMIIFYVFGYPVCLWVGMRYLRQYQKVTMARSVAEEHLDLVRAGRWIPVRAEDAAIVRVCNSFYADNSTQRRSISRSLLALISFKKRETKQEQLLARLGQQWKQMSARKRNCQPLELYILRTHFAKCSRDDPGSLEAAQKALKLEAVQVQAQAADSPMALTCAASGQEAGSTTPDGNAPATILLKDGRMIDDVVCIQKQTGTEGVVKFAPVTMLDDQSYAKVLGQFKDPFRDSCYCWQCYEIVRRMGQTGIVVLFHMLFNMNTALIYAVVLSMLAIVIQQRFSPYMNKALDDLQLIILVNQFAIQIMLIMAQMDGNASSFIGISMAVLQFLLLTCAMTLIVPAFRPVIKALTSKGLVMAKPISNRLSISLRNASTAATTPLRRLSSLISGKQENSTTDNPSFESQPRTAL
ncbi:hypothetical protein CYMTET_53701, partial [Cymbomonas tetramitiformis]